MTFFENLLSKVHEMEVDPNLQALPGGENPIDLPDDIVKGLCTDVFGISEEK